MFATPVCDMVSQKTHSFICLVGGFSFFAVFVAFIWLMYSVYPNRSLGELEQAIFTLIPFLIPLILFAINLIFSKFKKNFSRKLFILQEFALIMAIFYFIILFLAFAGSA